MEISTFWPSALTVLAGEKVQFFLSELEILTHIYSELEIELSCHSEKIPHSPVTIP